MNKFIKQYPKLWLPQIGDKVKVVQVLSADGTPTDELSYNIGDIGVITENDREMVIDIKIGRRYYTVYRREVELYCE
jgi:hypothetical protein